MQAQVNPDDILRRIEPRYFTDYTLFTGALRHYVAVSLEQEFRRAPNDLHRRLYVVGVVKEEYAGYEDLGAFLLAFLDWRQGKISLPIRALLGYSPGQAVIDSILQERSIAAGDDLYEALRLQEWVPIGWGKVFPYIDLVKSLKIACRFFAADCRRNQKRHGIKAYNKIKHGAMIVPNASRYIPTLPPVPAALFETLDKTDPNPYTVFAIHMDDKQIEQRQRSIEFLQNNLRLLSALYVVNHYAAELPSLGFNTPLALLEDDSCKDIRSFLRQVTERKDL